ncbi:hypothetical protein SBADM41S_01094 [Streptomyces badius]
MRVLLPIDGRNLWVRSRSTVLVVDDDALVRDGLRRILESADDIRVPAGCGPGEALELARLPGS